MSVRSSIVCLFLCCLYQIGYSQADQYRFSRIEANDGLSHNQVKSFFKDSRGFMWIGTVSGLNRFDGYNLAVFRNDPRNPRSISNDDINKMFEDPEGRIWILTWSGLDIYDPEKESFRYKISELVHKFNLPDSNIVDIVKDRKSNFWFVHQNQGLFYYSPKEKKTTHLFHKENDSSTISSNQVSQMQLDTSGNIWIIHRNGMIELIDAQSHSVLYRNDKFLKRFESTLYDYRFIVDVDNDLWIYQSETNRGVFYFNTTKKIFTDINRRSEPLRLSSEIIRGIVEDSHHMIWVATDHGGVNLINKKKGSVQYIYNSPEDEKSISQNSINTIYKDNDGIIWAGTFKRGINYYHPSIIRFPLYRHNTGNAGTGLPFDDINAFAEDEKGNLWIGTNGGGLIYFNRANQTFKQYLHEPANPNSLSTNVIVSLCYDHNKTLWIGTYFGGLNSFDGKNFTRYRSNPSDSSRISDDSIWEIYEDSENQLWVGTLAHGVDVFSPQRKKIANYSTYNTNTLHANYITSFVEDNGNMWIGTGYGIEVMDKKTGRFTHYLSQANNPSSLSNNSIISILKDSRGLIWIGTHGGLNLFDQKTNTFKVFTSENGLPHNSILTLAEDAEKNLWIGTPNGISNMVVDFAGGSIKVQFMNYDQYDGLQGKQFNENAILKTWKDELVFAGANGFNLFDPKKIPLNNVKPQVVMTELQILNKTVKIGEKLNNRIVLTKSPSLTDEVTFKPAENVFSIEFAALTFHHPEKTQYRYKLEGFDKNWADARNGERKITYTNLDPGDYTFKVIASNSDGIWSENGLAVKIHVLPPFWRTTYALGIYIILVLGALMMTRKIIQQRERMRFIIEQERQEAQRMHELDMMKIKFFTNVSHEFRTPLTLILTPIERLLNKTDDEVLKGHYNLIYRNARRLLNLVNQLLDFRKLEVQEIKFNPSEGDIVSFIKDTVFSFSDLSDKKNVQLNFLSKIETLETFFDQDKLEKILFNLLSNAFKFTPQNGRIDVELQLLPNHMLEILVRDNGIGIPADKLDKVFDRFFQSDLPFSMVNQGSGIGLSITREFVKSHGGTITVESEVGLGSTFRVILPVKEVTHVRITENAEPAIIHSGEDLNSINGSFVSDAAESEKNTDPVQGAKPSLLLVEDNEDFRFYLKDNLQLHYNVVQASDGKDGWSKVLSVLPDLVVSDVMMPNMNGLELCKKIKNDARVSHIPIILLTARSAEEQKLEGFDSGADDYITKPFSFEILQSRIRNLIHQREQFQKEFRQKVEVRASTIQITSLDEQLITKALKIVEDQIANPDFSVEELSHELGMSRVHLYKKLQALTGKSPLEFIRTIRLQRAAQLLEKSQLTVSEVAYKVGFNNPKYFARYFKEEYHVLPSAYASGKRADKSIE